MHPEIGARNEVSPFPLLRGAQNARKWPALDDDAKGGYLYRTVVNQARQWGRSASRRRRREALYASWSRLDMTSEETDWEVWETISSLTARQRAVVFLTYWSDLEGRRVAETLGISEGSVRRHLHLARKELRRRIDAWSPTDGGQEDVDASPSEAKHSGGRGGCGIRRRHRDGGSHRA
jgi:DNA-directed RNA polymerase specialized sigma24 family protein